MSYEQEQPLKHFFRHITNGLVCYSSCKQDSLTCHGFSGKEQKEEGLVLRFIKWKIDNFPLCKALHPPQVGKLLNDLHQESLTATSSHQQVLFFNDPISLDQHWNQGGTCCWLSAPSPEMVWHSRSQAAAVTGAWYWKPLRLVTFWTN